MMELPIKGNSSEKQITSQTLRYFQWIRNGHIYSFTKDNDLLKNKYKQNIFLINLLKIKNKYVLLTYKQF